MDLRGTQKKKTVEKEGVRYTYGVGKYIRLTYT